MAARSTKTILSDERIVNVVIVVIGIVVVTSVHLQTFVIIVVLLSSAKQAPGKVTVIATAI